MATTKKAIEPSDEVQGEIVPLSPELEEAAKLYNSPEAKKQREIEEVKRNRQAAYQAEADPIFFQAQREAGFKMEDWHAKIAEIEERFPYPEK
jgi:hypothetical protein